MTAKKEAVFLYGNGKMGSIHLEALCAAAKNGQLGAEIVVVEPKPVARAAAQRMLAQQNLSSASLVFATAAEAFSHRVPTIAVIACDDAQHKPVLDELRARAPGLKALFSEKPLTETIQQANSLLEWLDAIDLVTMNTVIHFSPVFSKFRAQLQPGGMLDGATLLGAEGAWLGNYLVYHRALPIGVAGDILHPLGVAVEVLGVGPVRMTEGKGVRGYLNDLSPDIIHGVFDSQWKGTETGLIARMRSCYSGDERERTVIGFYKRGKEILAAEFNFDRLNPDTSVADSFSLYRLNPGKPAELISEYYADEADIDVGFAYGARPGKAQAFVGQSLRALHEPNLRQTMTTVHQAVDIQRSIDAIGKDSSLLHLESKTGYETQSEIASARANGAIESVLPFGRSLALSSAENIDARLSWHKAKQHPLPLLAEKRAYPPASDGKISLS